VRDVEGSTCDFAIEARNSSRISDCVITSSALVASSAIQERGRCMNAHGDQDALRLADAELGSALVQKIRSFSLLGRLTLFKADWMARSQSSPAAALSLCALPGFP